ncbi:MAG TPA: ATP-binding protein [Actinomycetota bacterium]|nr:ATP-binding protein [Actinomycetota bacterium]
MEKLLAVAVAVAVLAIAFAVAELRASDHARRSSEILGRRIGALTSRLADLDEERRAMETVLSSMEEGVVLVSPVGGIRLINAAAERHLGTRPVTLSGLTPLGLQAIVRGAVADGEMHSLELETGVPSRWLRASAIPVGEGSVLLVVRDVTEARRTESIRRDFVANASHELKTPAASIRAAAETLATSALDDPAVVPRFADQLEREAIRLSRIVSDLLDLSRLEGGSDLDEEVALDALLRDEAERFERAAAEGGIRLSIRSEPAGRVRGSSRDLSLLIRNLVDNAIRYTRPGGTVDVSVGPENGLVVLSVEDTGIGIPSRDLPRVFERFYRVDRARSRETGGTGLGLSIVKHVVENHGGTVQVRSELGRGTTFVVRLPVAQPA